MTLRIAINGFGRIGRLALRAAWDWPDVEIVHLNEIAGDAATAAHLLLHDSVQGTWPHQVTGGAERLTIDGRALGYSRNAELAATPWRALGVDLVVDCTGHFKTRDVLAAYLDAGVPRVVVSAPVEGIPNIVMGVNDALCEQSDSRLFSAASCTTNCIAPVVAVLQREFGIRHGAITTVHDVTNSQRLLDDYHKDLRRARAAGLSLIPTTTGSARAIGDIFPELRGRLNGLAVRVPLANASLTDCVFELERATTVDEVNAALAAAAAAAPLAGILGYEMRPLVSVDYRGDSRSAVVDALSTQVIDGTLAKVLVWYDNETGYAHRLMELARRVGARR